MYWPFGIPTYYSISRSALVAAKEHEPQSATEDTGGSDAVTGHENGSVPTPPPSSDPDERIIDVKASRGGQLFATITSHTLSIWQTKPTVVLATAVRSQQSLDSYGYNTALLVRPDALIIVVQTSDGYLITYSLASDPSSQVYRLSIRATNGRRQSGDAIRRSSAIGPDYGAGDGSGIRDLSIRFRMVIRIDAGISSAIALDDELMVATAKPAAIQCIRWSPDKTGSSHDTEVLKRIPWISDQSPSIAKMVYNRPMGLHVWLSAEGRAYAVQHTRSRKQSGASGQSAYKGYCFHEPASDGAKAVHVAVNARFSLIAVGCADAIIRVYTAKDYTGNIPLSHELEPPVSVDKTGPLGFIVISPDGFSTFAGYEHGWAMWSVYGKPGATSLVTEQASNEHWWLSGVRSGFFAGGGTELFLLASDRSQLCSIDMARFSIAGCFDMANIHGALLQTSSGLMVRREGSGNGEDTTWQALRYPAPYLASHWPIKHAVISADGKYIAIAGSRGLAHYSTVSGRWKTFDDYEAEDEFVVRGGMCWHQHMLVAAVEVSGRSELRIFSRENSLSNDSAVFVEALEHPVICLALQNTNSLLVYTHANILLHYVFDASSSSVRLVNVGQIGFHGIIRAPARVRSISWIMPDEQRESGDPSQDVLKAAVLFLMDGKLVLLQPAPEMDRELKYDMRVIAHDVEYYLLAREGRVPDVDALTGTINDSLDDSLWYFDGTSMHVWPDVHELVSAASTELHQATPPPLAISTDFYPLTPLISAGTITGLEPSLIHRRDAEMAYFRASARSQLFLPPLLRHHLARFDAPAAQHLSASYRRLPYLSHALEVLLHNVLDDEADGQATQPGLAELLPFLSSFSAYLEIVLGCARKTEIRSWTTLFKHLPPVATLFEQALEQGKLKTAGGFLLVLHTFDEDRFTAEMMARLLREAQSQGDWELCRELARFLVGVDRSGDLLRQSLSGAGMVSG